MVCESVTASDRMRIIDLGNEDAQSETILQEQCDASKAEANNFHLHEIRAN